MTLKHFSFTHNHQVNVFANFLNDVNKRLRWHQHHLYILSYG